MSEEPRNDLVAAIVETIDERTSDQTTFLTAALVRGAWPGGISDGVQPAALEWVKRWGPARIEHRYLDACSCVEGRCGVCN